MNRAAASVFPAATADDLRRRAAGILRREGGGRIDAPDLDARLIVAEVWRRVLQRAPGDIISWSEATVPRAELAQVEALLAGLLRQRLDGAPVSRLTGTREFWSLPFRLSAETLDPRPDTETVVEAALAEILRNKTSAEGDLTIADLGTGSGAILLALLHELPVARGVGIDLSAGAAATARENAAALGLAGRARFVVGRWGSALAAESVDVLVSNPPYIASAEIESLAPEVRDHDPRLALDGGPDGLAAYRAILADLGRVLRPGGTAVVEIGIGQEAAVASIAAAFGFLARAVPDLAGIPRAAVLRPQTGAAPGAGGRTN